ncbi:uncharacterized protein LOC135950878 [Calliphora vicina]|uniref:uncharacterized protein LOC135950878 n=1 Tax=Calliphora vicina TaxID=7373 RepID=UPI00325B395B
MPTGPPNLGDNRFTLLADSISPKRKKTKYKDTTPFPQLPKVQPPNPKYIIMQTIDPKKPISSFSCFAVNRAIELISKDITSITQLRDGNLLLLVNNKQTADKFLQSKELVGLCTIQCKLHENLNSTKGTIYAPYLNDIPEDEIIRELSSQGVIDIYKFQKKIDDKMIKSGVVLLTFDLYHLPEKIKVSWNTVNIREYIPNPMRCKTCQKLGHTIKHCKNDPICVQCNLPPHKPSDCSRTQCANCLEEHAASSNKCTKFIQQKEILRIKIKNKCTISEAKRIHKSSISLISPNASFSSIVSNYTPTPNIAKNKNDITHNTNYNKNITVNKEIEKNENKEVSNKTAQKLTINSTAPSTSSTNNKKVIPNNPTTITEQQQSTTEQIKQNQFLNNQQLLNRVQEIINKPGKQLTKTLDDAMDYQIIQSSEEE